MEESLYLTEVLGKLHYFIIIACVAMIMVNITNTIQNHIYKKKMQASISEKKAIELEIEGEKEVIKRLKNIEGHKVIFKRLILPKETTRFFNTYGYEDLIKIDALIIYEKGIVCIDIKNYGGMITGNQKNEKWYQKVNKKKYTFFNPLMEMEEKISVVQLLINLKDVKVKSVIAFSSRAILNVKSNKNNVLNINEIEMYLEKKTILNLSKKQIDYIADIISITNLEPEIREQHKIAELRRKMGLDC